MKSHLLPPERRTTEDDSESCDESDYQPALEYQNQSPSSKAAANKRPLAQSDNEASPPVNKKTESIPRKRLRQGQHAEARTQRQSSDSPNPPAWPQYYDLPSSSLDVVAGYAAAHEKSCKQSGLSGLSGGAYTEDGHIKAVAIAKYVVPFRTEQREKIPPHQTHTTKMAYYHNLSAQKKREFDIYATKEIEKLFSGDVRKELARLRSGVGKVGGSTTTGGINGLNEGRTVTNTSDTGNDRTRVGGQTFGIVRSPTDTSHGSPSATMEISNSPTPQNTQMGPQTQSPSSPDLVALLSARAPAPCWSTASRSLSPRSQLNLADQTVHRLRDLVGGLRYRTSLEESNLEAATIWQRGLLQSYPPFEGGESQTNSNNYYEGDNGEENADDENNNAVDGRSEERPRRSGGHTSDQINDSVDVQTGEHREPVVTESEVRTVAGYGTLLVPPPRPPGAVTTEDDYLASTAQEAEHYQRLTTDRQRYIDRAGPNRLRGG